MPKRLDKNSPEYWEKVLKQHGLGIDYRGASVQTDDSDEVVTDAPVFQSSKNFRDDFEKLRKKYDGNDGFMRGHQIQKVRKRDDQNVFEWAFNDSKVRLLLLSVFPKLGINQRQRTKAARWLRVIYLYFRMRLPYPTVAKELSIDRVTLNNLVNRITRVSKGLRANNTGKKVRDSFQTPPENTPEGTGREENAGDTGK